jgi:hypothetical protein
MFLLRDKPREWKSPGQCTRYPTWVSVAHNHFCGEQRDAQAIYENRNGVRDDVMAQEGRQQTRAIAAEKLVKELRARIRELKAAK